MTIHADLGASIREARLKKGLSLGQLASAVGRSSSSVRRWERGEVAPAAPVIPKLAAILEIDQEVLEVGEGADVEPDGGQPPQNQDGRVSTVEQPIVAIEESLDESGDPETVENRRVGMVSDVLGAFARVTSDWMGWVRGIFTAVILILMLVVTIWAMSELFDALGDVAESFDFGGTNQTVP